MLVDNLQTVAYLRIASLSIALYDYLLTLPAEWRFYKNQSSILHLTTGCILFILIRYVSIVVLIISNYGYFSSSFTQEDCQKFNLAAPICKILQAMVSNAIMGVRAFSIARRVSWVKWFMILLYTITTILESFTDIYHHSPARVDGSCLSVDDNPHRTSWSYYVLAMIYDIATLSISTMFLYRFHIRDGHMSRLLMTMLYDGLGYFVVLTASNIFNLIVFQTNTEAGMQTAGASLGYTVTWICSQQLLIHLREIATENASKQMENSVLVHRLQNGRDIKTAVRSQLDKMLPISRSLEDDTDKDVELDVHVYIERSVTVDYPPKAYDVDSCRKANPIV